MASWHDPERWQALRRGTDCPLCAPVREHVVAKLGVSRVTVDERVLVRGYCCVVLDRHAVELHDVPAAEAAALMTDIRTTGRALQQVTGALKLNYEMYGNVVPHVHLHLVPRYAGDEIERTGARFGALREPVWEPGEFAAFEAALRSALAAPREPT